MSVGSWAPEVRGEEGRDHSSLDVGTQKDKALAIQQRWESSGMTQGTACAPWEPGQRSAGNCLTLGQ